MSIGSYLPSAKFLVMVGSLALSGGLVLAAQYVTRPTSGAAIVSNDAAGAENSDWKAALQEVEDAAGIKAPEAPSQESLNELLEAAQSPNLTTAVGQTLLVSLSNANSQGLGNDIPTQEQLIAEATAQINAAVASSAYTSADLNVAAQTSGNMRTYGNAVMSVFAAHPEASVQETYLAVGRASDAQDQDALANLSSIAAGYRNIEQKLLALPVPATLSPLHLQLVNDFAAMQASYADMETILTDPLRGLAALQRFSSLSGEAARVLTNIATALNRDGILFSKDEPGAAWDVFVSSQP